MNYFIFYESSIYWQTYYKTVIDQIMQTTKEQYQFLILSNYSKQEILKLKKMGGKKVFLLHLEEKPKSGYEIANEIRKSGDWKSQMILITDGTTVNSDIYMNRLLLLDFLSKTELIKEQLEASITHAFHILSCHQTFKFILNNEFHQIPYDDILYFEKELNNNYTAIFTRQNYKNPYKIKQSITKIEKELVSTLHFFKTHQSCIVNLYNISHIDYKAMIIYFSYCNLKTNLLSRDRKKVLKEKMKTIFPYSVV